MGIMFSRPGHVGNAVPDTAYAAGNVSSAGEPNIGPYLGYNTGSYAGIASSSLPPVPFEWIVSPSEVTSATTCPTGSQMLLLFGLTELAVAALAPLLAYRPLVHRLSRGYLGRRRKYGVAVNWAVVFASQLLANAIVAGMVGNTPGYGGLNMLHVFTVYATRPRAHVVVLAVLRSVVGVQRGRETDRTGITRSRVDDRVEFPYADAYLCVALAELPLLLVSALFAGVTWDRFPQSSYREFMNDAKQFLESTPGVMLLCMLAFVPVYKRYGDAFPIEGRRYETGRQWRVTVSRDGQASLGVKDKVHKKVALKRFASAMGAIVFMGFVCLVHFTYWTRFLELPGALFCPPKLVETGIVWAIFSLFGIFVGACA